MNVKTMSTVAQIAGIVPIGDRRHAYGLPLDDEADGLEDLINTSLLALTSLQIMGAFTTRRHGYPTLSPILNGILHKRVEDVAGMWEHLIPPDHPMHRYTDRHPWGGMAVAHVDDAQQAIDLAFAVLDETRRACAIADAWEFSRRLDMRMDEIWIAQYVVPSRSRKAKGLLYPGQDRARQLVAERFECFRGEVEGLLRDVAPSAVVGGDGLAQVVSEAQRQQRAAR